MKWSRFKFYYVLILVMVFLICSSLNVSAAGTGSFEVGAFWQPPEKPVDYNTDANWANIAAASIDVVMGHRLGGSYNITLNKNDNETGIANSYANDVKLLCVDSSISDVQSYTAADYTNLTNAVTPYANDSRVAGFLIKDEPLPYVMEGYANTFKRIKQIDPDLQCYGNLLPISTESILHPQPGRLVLSNSGARGTGSYVRSSNSIGQTFKVPAGVTFIHGIDMYIDSSEWSSSEVLTLKLWNSPSKTSLLGQCSIIGTGLADEWRKYPFFGNLNAAVEPGATYYFELTHNGGGDNAIGWVVRSAGDAYTDGTGYENGVARAYDFYFRVYVPQNNIGRDYETYIDSWLNMSGSDYLLYDNYPFRATGDDVGYFHNAEVIRNRGLANDVIYGGFLQSIEVSNSSEVLLRDPTFSMMRYNVYTYLTYGYKKMYWFTYWKPDAIPSEIYDKTPVDFDGTLLTKYSQIQTLNSEMRNLGKTLKNLTSRRVYHTGASIPLETNFLPDNFFIRPADLTQPIIVGYFTDPNDRSYVMLTNRDYNNSRTLDFYLNPSPSTVAEISKTTGAEVNVPGYNASTGVLNISLNPGEGRLYALPAGYSPFLNLAALATVTASSSYEASLYGWGINKVNDDSRNTVNGNGKSCGWTSNNNLGVNHTESLTFDLGSVKTVGEVDLFPRNDSGYVGGAFPIDFTIQVAVNAGGPWTTVVSQVGYGLPGNAGQYFAFEPVTARYVKIEGTNLRVIAGAYRMQFAEVEIYSSANFAKTSSVTATSTLESSAWGMGKAKDAIRNSITGSAGWTSNNSLTADHTESITFDMGSYKTVHSVNLCPRNDYGNAGAGFPINFTIKVATNAEGPWTTVVTQTGYPNPGAQTQSFTFTPQTARYVKIEGTSLSRIANEAGQPYRMQFAEVEILGNPDSEIFVSGKILGTLRNNSTVSIGMKITVGNKPITVKELGRYFVSGNTGTHTLKINRFSDNAEIASATINMASGSADSLGFKYVSLASPVTLSANTAYVISSTETSGGDSWYDANTVISHSGVATVDYGVYYSGGWINAYGTNNSYGPLSFKYN